MHDSKTVRAISPESLREGMMLALDVQNIHGDVLVHARTRITDSTIRRIMLSGLDRVFIFTPQGFEKEKKVIINTDIDKRSTELEGTFQLIQETGEVPKEKLYGMVRDAVSIAEDMGGVSEYLKLLREKNEYTFTHSISVGIMCSMLGKWLDLTKAEAEDLVVAASLHDVGKLSIDLKILEKPSFLTSDEFDTVKQHPLFGYKILEKSKVSDSIRLAVLEHHERPDGAGYPHNKITGSISPFGGILAIADVYDALSSKRPYRDALSPFVALEIMQEESGIQFFPKELDIFINNIVNAYLGARVELSDGNKGEIAHMSSTAILRPIIKLDGGKMINLSYHPDTKIHKIL